MCLIDTCMILFREAKMYIPRWPSEKQREVCSKGLQDPLVQAAFRPQRKCRECGAPHNCNHHEECWTGIVELRLSKYENKQFINGQ